MAKSNPTDSGALRLQTTNDEDDQQEAAVLGRVLELYPATLTMDELVREMTGGGSREFSEVDPIQRAVRELAGSGLLHRPGDDEMVHPTLAARRYFDLSDGAL